MALINCPECGRQVSDQAEKCPGCGAIINKKTARKNAKKGKKRKWFIPVIILVVLLIVGGITGAFFIINGKVPLVQNKEDRIKANIWEYIQPTVAAGLKFPDSAEFPDESTAVIVEEDGRYHVIGYTVAKNGGGNQANQGFELYVTVSDKGEPSECSAVSYVEDSYYTLSHEAYQQREEKGGELLTGDALEKALAGVELTVTETSITQKESMVTALGDFLSATVKNNSDNVIQSCTVAFVGWDKSKLPLKLERSAINDASYMTQVHYDNLNLKSGKTYGKDQGMYIDESSNIKTAKAIVYSYTTMDGTTWTNPYFADFYFQYVGKSLEGAGKVKADGTENDVMKIKKNMKYSFEDVCEFNIVKVNISGTVKPPRINQNAYAYEYFEADAGEQFVEIIMDIKNLRDSSVKQDEVLDNAYVVAGDSEYKCSVVVEEDNGSKLNQYTSLDAISSKQKLRYHMLAQIPAELTMKDMDFYVDVEGQELRYPIER